MSDDGPESGVGSVGEEAAKLFAAFAGAAREQGGQYAGAAAGVAAAAARAAHDLDEHLATGSAECQWCPVCRVVHAVRQTSPEVREHLSVAAGALAQAAAGLLATHPSRPERSKSGGVHPIHLDEDVASDVGPDRGPGSGSEEDR